MYIKKETEKVLNEVMQQCFLMNAKFDLVAYWLDKNGYIKATESFHEKVSHKTPLWADEISTYMVQEGAQPVRLGLETQNRNFTNVEELFFYAKEAFEAFEEKTLEAIEIADLNNDVRPRIFLENFVIDKNVFLKQMNIFYNKAVELKDTPATFDKYFNSFVIV